MNISQKSDKLFEFLLWILIINYSIQQIIMPFRHAKIYNVYYLYNVFNLICGCIIIFLFFKSYIHKKFILSISEFILISIPFLSVVWGIAINGFSMIVLRDTFNAVIFSMLLCLAKNNEYEFQKTTLLKIANIQLVTMLISTMAFYLLALLGYNSPTVGRATLQMAFALAIFTVYKKRKRAAFCILWFIWAGKRGVLLAIFALIFIIFLMDKRFKKSYKIMILSILCTVGIGAVILTSKTEYVEKCPQQLQPLLKRCMLINPLSDRFDPYADGRLDEIISAMKPLQENKLYWITGMGAGYVYTYIFQGRVYVEEHHNVHISPVGFLTRYGIIYTMVIYWYMGSVLYKSYKALNRKRLGEKERILLYYGIMSFVFSFTSFNIYINQIYILALGFLNKKNLSLEKRDDYGE